MRISPLTTVIEQGRGALIYGKLPDPSEWGMAMLTGTLLACIGFALFQKMRAGFADVL
jgi:lipopolysaccharide transport system permease protein